MAPADRSAATVPHAHDDTIAVDEREAGRLLGVSPKTVSRLPDAAVGRVRIGRRVVYYRAQLERYLRSLLEPPATGCP